jgi:hypothetical protein
MKLTHTQAFINLENGSRIAVDKNIRNLIRIMNTDGIETFNSCQDNNQQGYVQFGGEKAAEFIAALTYCFVRSKKDIIGGIHLENGRNNSVWPNTFTLRWRTYDYRQILKLVKEAFWKMQADELGLW